jgi:hypothetical protein
MVIIRSKKRALTIHKIKMNIDTLITIEKELTEKEKQHLFILIKYIHIEKLHVLSNFQLPRNIHTPCTGFSMTLKKDECFQSDAINYTMLCRGVSWVEIKPLKRFTDEDVLNMKKNLNTYIQDVDLNSAGWIGIYTIVDDYPRNCVLIVAGYSSKEIQTSLIQLSRKKRTNKQFYEKYVLYEEKARQNRFRLLARIITACDFECIHNLGISQIEQNVNKINHLYKMNIKIPDHEVNFVQEFDHKKGLFTGPGYDYQMIQVDGDFQISQVNELNDKQIIYYSNCNSNKESIVCMGPLDSIRHICTNNQLHITQTTQLWQDREESIVQYTHEHKKQLLNIMCDLSNFGNEYEIKQQLSRSIIQTFRPMVVKASMCDFHEQCDYHNVNAYASNLSQ